MKSSWRWLKVTCGICFGALIITTLYFGGIFLRVNYWCPKLEVKEYTESTDFDYNLETDYEISDIKRIIDSDFRIPYFYRVENIHAGGMTFMQLRLIKVDALTVLSKPYYAYVLAHELTHLKYMNGNECWTEFNAWKYLYENDDTFLHNVALWRANYITQSKIGNEYDCGYWIILYLTEKQIYS